MTQKVTFWFDVSCPFCWLTSRWVKEVEKVRDISVDWVPMSLSVLNDGRDLPTDYASKMEANWGPARVFAKVKAEAPEKIDELYTAMGTLIHPGGESGKQGFGAYDAVIAQALEKVGLDASLLPWPTRILTMSSCAPTTSPPWTKSAMTWAPP